ncbi:MAG: chemotaxis protein CheW [Heliobacteriaceae bacterium]|nr:chemotaxis protein CheW [Heliobacteriaceae bacterium]MDD4587228.1 chemotaxis protein CheW [Heliobacteriaceae bacterium]
MGFDNELQLVAFFLGGEEYAVDIHYVREINRLLNITRVPRAPYYIEGVINLRGNVVPVIDLRKRFNLAATEMTDRTRIVVIQTGEIMVGLIVDGVSEVMRLSATSIEPPPALISSVHQEFLYGVGKLEERLLILLNLERVIDLDIAC